MHLKLGSLLLAIVLPVVGLAQTTVNSVTYAPGTPVVVTDPTSVTTGAGAVVTVSAFATVVYQAGTTVKLEPGFTATKGSSFYIAIGSVNVDSDGDGLPDVWERAYGLNPSSAADGGALAIDGGGLTNLQVYLANMFPTPLQGLAVAVAPGGLQLILQTPLKRFYGVNTTDWSIVTLPAP